MIEPTITITLSFILIVSNGSCVVERYCYTETPCIIGAKCGYLGGAGPHRYGPWGGAPPPGLEPVGGRGAGQWNSGGSCGMAGLHTNL